jgi:hypothetical protein
MNKITEDVSADAAINHFCNCHIGEQFSLIVPKLMPDEFLLGYFGRFGLSNGFPNYLSAKRKINHIFRIQLNKERQYPLPLQLADILNINPEKIVADHTLVPILRSPEHSTIPSHDVKVLKAMGYIFVKPNVCFCESCISEDLSYLGYSYWRRSHQIHGVDFCSKHGTQLMVAIDENSHYRSPNKILKQRRYLLPKTTLTEYEHPVIKKYIELLMDCIENKPKINFISLVKILDHRKLTNSIANPHVKHSFISDIIFDNTPTNWLIEHFPIFSEKEKNIPITRIDFIKDHIENSPSLFNLLLMISNLMPEANYQTLQSESLSNLVPKRINTIGKSTAILLYKKYLGKYNLIFGELIKLKIGSMHYIYRLGLLPLDDLDDATSKAIFDFLDGTSLMEIMRRETVNFTAFEKKIKASSKLTILKS